MGRLNQDTIIAIFLLLVSGGLMVASFDIREPDYGQLSPATWPRVVVGVLGFLSFLYLIQSLRGTGAPVGVDLPEARDGAESSGANVKPSGAAGFFGYWRNVIWCFSLFLIYLLTMPYLGMLIGGVSFAFLLLMTALGGWQPRQLLLHAVDRYRCRWRHVGALHVRSSRAVADRHDPAEVLSEMVAENLALALAGIHRRVRHPCLDDRRRRRRPAGRCDPGLHHCHGRRADPSLSPSRWTQPRASPP